MRTLAADLGVSTMSLYGHVRDKDDLLDDVVDRLIATRWRPASDPGEWRGWIREAAERFRDLLISEPVVLHVFLAHPVVTPHAIERMESMLGVLSSAGLDHDEAERAYAAIHTYTVGFAALEASRAKHADEREPDDPLRQRLARFTTREQFSEGLGYLLEGLFD